jgi:hypothetical protein
VTSKSSQVETNRLWIARSNYYYSPLLAGIVTLTIKLVKRWRLQKKNEATNWVVTAASFKAAVSLKAAVIFNSGGTATTLWKSHNFVIQLLLMIQPLMHGFL